MIKFENQHKYISYQNIVRSLFPFVDGSSVYKTYSNLIPWETIIKQSCEWAGNHLSKSRPRWVNYILIIRKKGNLMTCYIKVLF